MALSAATVWEVRPTNGTANAGGGFVTGASGTDRSQQNAVQTAFTDLVLATTTTLTSAAFPFGAADVGNILAITGGTGFTVGLYQIVSVSVVTATIDRVGGTAASTGGTGNLGGARSGFSNGTTPLQGSGVTAAGNKIYVKQEAWNEAMSWAQAGGAAASIVIEGYKTTRGDGNVQANQPINNRASAAGDAITLTASNVVLRYLQATAAGDSGFNISIFRVRCEFCKSFSNTGKGFKSTVADSNVLIGCEANNNTSNGVGPSFGGTAIGLYSHDNGAAGVTSNGSSYSLSFCIVDNNVGGGIIVNGTESKHWNNTVDGNTGATADGIAFDTPFVNVIVLNNIFSNNGRDGARSSTNASPIYADYNNYFGNAGVARTNFPTGANDSTLDPTFTDRAGGNFAIGTNLKALGFPGAFPAALSTGYLDIGAVQRLESAGGGSSATKPANLRGNMQ